MNNVINSFRKQYYFLSNFYMAPVTYNGCTFKNNEAAFQAQKCPNEMKAFCNMDPSEAKRYGRRVTLRKDWENVKFTIMYDIVYAKFTQNQDLKVKLLATGNAHLEEGNTWGDKTWGTVNGVGQNCLGKILMDVREYLRKEMEQTKALIVLERSNGMYGGYEMRNGRYVQLFNFSAELLFMSVKSYTDKGYTVKCLDKTDEAEFMKNRTTLESFSSNDNILIWRYDVTSPFALGSRKRKPIATEICPGDYPIQILERGFTGIIITKGPAKGVYELSSGGLVGDTVEMVNNDIRACGDINVMQAQIKEAMKIRDNDAVLVTAREFGLLTEEVSHE